MWSALSASLDSDVGNSAEDVPGLQLADFLLMKRIEQACSPKGHGNAKKEYRAGACRQEKIRFRGGAV